MLADVRTGALVKVAIVRGRTTLVAGDRVVDAERASGGGVPADPAATFTAWPSLLNIAAGLEQEGPGDVILTGTPAGVGWSREPEELLHAGSRIDTTIGVIGTLTTRVVGR